MRWMRSSNDRVCIPGRRAGERLGGEAHHGGDGLDRPVQPTRNVYNMSVTLLILQYVQNFDTVFLMVFKLKFFQIELNYFKLYPLEI